MDHPDQRIPANSRSETAIVAPRDGTERRPQSGSFERSYERGDHGDGSRRQQYALRRSARVTGRICSARLIRCTSARRGESVAAAVGPVVDACGRQCIRQTQATSRRAGDRVVGALHFFATASFSELRARQVR